MRRLCVALALLLCACDQPPTRELEAAEAALEEARRADAARFAPERFREAETALAEARQRLQSNDYRGALSSAMDTVDRSRGAVQAAKAARNLAKGTVEVSQVEVQAALDDWAALRDQARKAKVPDTVFADVDARGEEVRRELRQVSDALAAGDVLAAQKLALELKARVTSLPETTRQAQARWEAERPKARGRARLPPRTKPRA